MKSNYPYRILIVLLFWNTIILSGQSTCLPGGITFTTQQQIDDFATNYPGCTTIQGDLFIQETVPGNITNLAGLAQIQTIEGSVWIVFNTALTDLNGLDNLNFIGGVFGLYYNVGLTNLSGLNSITAIGGSLDLVGNSALTSISDLDNLTSIGGYLTFVQNNGVTSLTGLENLTSIGNSLNLVQNSGLTNLTGLENLNSIEKHIVIQSNPALTSLEALANLNSIGGVLFIMGNSSLTSLSGLENIDPNSINNLGLSGSGNLSFCEVESICSYLSDPTNPAFFYNNATGCNTRAEVEAACDALPSCTPGEITSAIDLEITQSNLPQWCQGIKVLTVKIGNIDELQPPFSYSWSNESGSTQQITALSNATYSVTVTDGNFCSSAVSTIVNADLSTLLSAHTIISGEELEMTESTVLSGGVGVLDAEEATIQNNTVITTFLRAAGVSIDGSSTVADYINSNSPLILPPFQSNSFNANNSVYVPSGGSMTLSGSNYGNVVVGKNATLTIDNGNIYLKSLIMHTASTLIFNQPTNMMVKKKMNIGMMCNVNVEGPNTVIYAGDKTSVGQGSTIQANIYAPEGLEVNDSGSSLTTYMTGLFISNDQVSSDDNVVWGWNLNCNYPLNGAGTGAEFSQPNPQSAYEIVQNRSELLVYPNPAAGVLNIDLRDYLGQSIKMVIYNYMGQQVLNLPEQKLQKTIMSIDLNNPHLPDGIYLLNVKSEKSLSTIQFMIAR